jgi:hypothetical protein
LHAWTSQRAAWKHPLADVRGNLLEEFRTKLLEVAHPDGW